MAKRIALTFPILAAHTMGLVVNVISTLITLRQAIIAPMNPPIVQIVFTLTSVIFNSLGVISNLNTIRNILNSPIKPLVGATQLLGHVSMGAFFITTAVGFCFIGTHVSLLIFGIALACHAYSIANYYVNSRLKKFL